MPVATVPAPRASSPHPADEATPHQHDNVLNEDVATKQCVKKAYFAQTAPKSNHATAEHESDSETDNNELQKKINDESTYSLMEFQLKQTHCFELGDKYTFILNAYITMFFEQPLSTLSSDEERQIIDFLKTLVGNVTGDDSENGADKMEPTNNTESCTFAGLEKENVISKYKADKGQRQPTSSVQGSLVPAAERKRRVTKRPSFEAAGQAEDDTVSASVSEHGVQTAPRQEPDGCHSPSAGTARSSKEARSPDQGSPRAPPDGPAVLQFAVVAIMCAYSAYTLYCYLFHLICVFTFLFIWDMVTHAAIAGRPKKTRGTSTECEGDETGDPNTAVDRSACNSKHGRRNDISVLEKTKSHDMSHNDHVDVTDKNGDQNNEDLADSSGESHGGGNSSNGDKGGNKEQGQSWGGRGQGQKGPGGAGGCTGGCGGGSGSGGNGGRDDKGDDKERKDKKVDADNKNEDGEPEDEEEDTADNQRPDNGGQQQNPYVDVTCSTVATATVPVSREQSLLTVLPYSRRAANLQTPCLMLTVAGPLQTPCLMLTVAGPLQTPCLMLTVAGPLQTPCLMLTVAGPLQTPCLMLTVAGPLQIPYLMLTVTGPLQTLCLMLTVANPLQILYQMQTFPQSLTSSTLLISVYFTGEASCVAVHPHWVRHVYLVWLAPVPSCRAECTAPHLPHNEISELWRGPTAAAARSWLVVISRLDVGGDIVQDQGPAWRCRPPEPPQRMEGTLRRLSDHGRETRQAPVPDDARPGSLPDASVAVTTAAREMATCATSSTTQSPAAPGLRRERNASRPSSQADQAPDSAHSSPRPAQPSRLPRPQKTALRHTAGTEHARASMVRSYFTASVGRCGDMASRDEDTRNLPPNLASSEGSNVSPSQTSDCLPYPVQSVDDLYSRASTEPEDGEEEGGPMGAEGGPDNGYGVASQPPSHQSPDIGPCAPARIKMKPWCTLVAVCEEDLTDARYRRAEEEYRRLRRPYLCHRCRWKIFQLLCLPCEHMVCFGCVVFTWPWCPVCSAFIEDPVNIQFAS